MNRSILAVAVLPAFACTGSDGAGQTTAPPVTSGTTGATSVTGPTSAGSATASGTSDTASSSSTGTTGTDTSTGSTGSGSSSTATTTATTSATGATTNGSGGGMCAKYTDFIECQNAGCNWSPIGRTCNEPNSTTGGSNCDQITQQNDCTVPCIWDNQTQTCSDGGGGGSCGDHQTEQACFNAFCQWDELNMTCI